MINFYNSDKLKRLSSAIILTTMLGTSFTLSGCSKTSDKETVQLETSHKDEEKRKDYGVVIENDIAVIYTIHDRKNQDGGWTYHSYLLDGSTSSIDSTKRVILTGSKVHYLCNYTLEEAELYAGNLLSENGVIRYYNVEEKENPRILTLTK